MRLTRWNPNRGLVDLEREFGQLFRDWTSNENHSPEHVEQNVWKPAADIVELKDRFEIAIDVPGVTPENIKVKFDDGVLQVSAERKFENETDEGNVHRVERRYGKFLRRFTLPDTVSGENIQASASNGQLIVKLPKIEKAQPKEIEINVAS